MAKYTFREFIKKNPFQVSLCEDETAPPGGAVPPSPTDPNNSNTKHFDMMKVQLGIDDDDFLSALGTSDITLWQIPDYSRKWGFKVAGTCQASIRPRSDGNYAVTFKLRDKKLMEPHSFMYPQEQGQNPIGYRGPVEDKTEILTSQDLQKLMSIPLQGSGGGMGGPGMGGPGMGAPMGAPAGMGGMGAE